MNFRQVKDRACAGPPMARNSLVLASRATVFAQGFAESGARSYERPMIDSITEDDEEEEEEDTHRFCPQSERNRSAILSCSVFEWFRSWMSDRNIRLRVSSTRLTFQITEQELRSKKLNHWP